MRLLEGEALLYGGVVYLVKGYQHPEGFVVAYPRYKALQQAKLEKHEAAARISELYWDCIKLRVPVVPLSKAYEYSPRPLNRAVEYAKSFLESLLEVELHPTGSSLVSEGFRDLDFAVYGAPAWLVDRLRLLLNKGVLKRPLGLLVSEYLDKHAGYLKLEDYLYLKKNTILHFYFGGLHVNLKLLEYEKGFGTCVDYVYSYGDYTGVVSIERPLNPHVLPARYSARVGGREVVVESLRELYAELQPGTYYAERARLEARKGGIYLVPDHGVLRPLT
ncbi:MAG: hypothetical protein ACP5KA_05920 [Desulfurococcaceae archaeon]